jgi:hypothetical protein
MMASPITSTGIVAESEPAGMSVVPEACTKSMPGVAVPPLALSPFRVQETSTGWVERRFRNTVMGTICVAVLLLPSLTVWLAMVAMSGSGPSSLRMVSVALPSLMVLPMALLSTTRMVSSGSGVPSEATPTIRLALVWPGTKVRVPERPSILKSSLLAAAVPGSTR